MGLDGGEKPYLNELFTISRDAILVTDTDRMIVDYNPAFSELFGYSLPELIGSKTDVLYADAAEFEEMGRQLRDHLDDPNFFHTITYVTKAGEIFPGETNAFYLKDEDGTVLGFIGSIRDVSERVQREAELLRERDRLDEFATVLSHDLRNPLSIAQGRLELLRDDADSEGIQVIGRALDRIQAIIDDVLALAREARELGETERVALAVLAEACRETLDFDGAVLHTETDQIIRADSSRLQQLLENLFRNAIEHGGDDVTITLGTLPDGFYVADDGPGIPESDRDTVLTAGYSTSKYGTGFGLSIVAQIAQAHGWQLRVTEGAAGGARFEITGTEFVT